MRTLSRMLSEQNGAYGGRLDILSLRVLLAERERAELLTRGRVPVGEPPVQVRLLRRTRGPVV